MVLREVVYFGGFPVLISEVCPPNELRLLDLKQERIVLRLTFPIPVEQWSARLREHGGCCD
jgi:hypothetical protein